MIDVLANDSDEDADTLTITNATAQYGEVIIKNNQLTYTPLAGYDGIDLINYTIDDGRNGNADAQVKVSVTAYETIVVTNKSSGGSFGYIILLLSGLAFITRHLKHLKAKHPQTKSQQVNKGSAFITVLSFMLISFTSQAQWSVNGTLGQSTVKNSSALTAQHPNSEVSQISDSDTSWSLGVSYRFDNDFLGSDFLGNNLRLGVQYIDMGEAGLTLTSDSLTPTQYHESVADAAPMLVDGFALEAGYLFWQSEHFEAEVILGALSWQGDINSQISSQDNNKTISTNKDGTDIYYGLIGYYQLTPQWQLGLGYQRFKLSVNDVDMLYLSVDYQF